MNKDDVFMRILKKILGKDKYANLLVAAQQGKEEYDRVSEYAYDNSPDEDYKQYISKNLDELERMVPGLKNAFKVAEALAPHPICISAVLDIKEGGRGGKKRRKSKRRKSKNVKRKSKNLKKTKRKSSK